MYIVKEYFEDMLDEHHPYNAGDEYPRKGYSASKERIKELSGNNNVRGRPLVVKKTVRRKRTKTNDND